MCLLLFIVADVRSLRLLRPDSTEALIVRQTVETCMHRLRQGVSGCSFKTRDKLPSDVAASQSLTAFRRLLVGLSVFYVNSKLAIHDFKLL